MLWNTWCNISKNTYFNLKKSNAFETDQSISGVAQWRYRYRLTAMTIDMMPRISASLAQKRDRSAASVANARRPPMACKLASCAEKANVKCKWERVKAKQVLEHELVFHFCDHEIE